ncbi:CaiB/BaiF CoA transferase family protein [Agrococcus citreus]|uniref:CoA transferase n=1 Tax=Agrococcus citreus TaxID=84643 RepID=A0ABN1YTX1_9MICO
MTPRPLAGRRIVDLSQYIAGPACAQVLADFGADVIKVEPLAGDPSRSLGDTGLGSVYFRQYNTGKRSIRLDLAGEEGRAALAVLLADADAVVMNFAARTRRKLGLDWERLHRDHPELVVVCITAYGIDDDRTALDSVVQAQSGFAMLNADEHGEPRISGGYPTDVFSGLYGGLSAAMALLDPARSGGVLIDVPMIEVAMTALAGTAVLAAAGGAAPAPGRGNRDLATAPSTVFDCEDGRVYIYAGLDKHWELLRHAVGGPAATAAERLADPERFEAAVQSWTARRSVDEVLEETARLGIAAAPVARVEDALAALQRVRPGAVVRSDDRGIPVPQFPVTFSGERIARTDAPAEETP